MSDLAKKIDDHVGRQIRKRRNLLGLTQDQLADALGISYQQVQKYETAANRVSAGRLFEIAAKLDTEIGFFFEGLDPSLLATPVEHGGKSRSTVDLVRSFDGIRDGAVRSAVVGLIKELGGNTD
ncbi:MAG: helix-turn-helix transcriptional regulator [Alphaproteobacteria bacterium]|nr:helix-turn-helix transcriptional regulator [Alphaproteobacteria bacterium]